MRNRGADGAPPGNRRFACYVDVNDVDALHRELLAKGANVQGEPVSQPWGLREFRVLDRKTHYQ